MAPLLDEANATIEFLTDKGLLTQEHSLSVALIRAICEEWEHATNSTQRSNLAKELRTAIVDLLPKVELPPDDAAQSFFDSLTENV